jgi:hypothetical protein
MVGMKKVLIMFSVLLLTACEQIDVGEVLKNDNVFKNVTLHVGSAEPEVMGTRAEVPLSDVCGRLNVAVFDAAGQKVKTAAQVVSDAGYGTVGLSLNDGKYTVVVIGHNCTGSATITNAEKVTFPNNKVTDTFYYCGALEVTGEKQDVKISLQRAVAMIRLKLTDDAVTMANVAQVKFYYLGGSSTFSPLAGFGCVNSKQTEYRTVSADGVYELYTMPHSAMDVVTKMTVTALDAGDNVVGEFTIDNVPVSVNRITDCTGSLKNGAGTVNVSITVNPDWDGVEWL